MLVRTHYQSSALDKTIKKFFLLYECPFHIIRSAGPNSFMIGDDRGVEISKQNVINLKPFRVMSDTLYFFSFLYGLS